MIEIRPVNRKTALYSVMNWHYSKNMPTGKNVYLGVWEDNVFIGVVIYGLGACSSYHQKFNLKKNEVIELTRVALKKHNEFTSKIVNLSLKIIKKRNPLLKAVISFADSNQGHTGKLYQACNFYYIGKTAKSKLYYSKITGKKIHNRRMSNKGYKVLFGKICKCELPQDCNIVIEEPKIRYIYIFDKNNKDLMNIINKLKLNYIKSVNDVNKSMHYTNNDVAV